MVVLAIFFPNGTYVGIGIVFENVMKSTKKSQSRLQWGSENRTCPVFEWSKVDRFTNGPVFEWHLKTGHLSGFRMVLA